MTLPPAPLITHHTCEVHEKTASSTYSVRSVSCIACDVCVFVLGDCCARVCCVLFLASFVRGEVVFLCLLVFVFYLRLVCVRPLSVCVCCRFVVFVVRVVFSLVVPVCSYVCGCCVLRLMCLVFASAQFETMISPTVCSLLRLLSFSS